MNFTIIDTPDDCTDKVAALKAAGVTAIMRYDDPSGNPNSWKQIGYPEYNAILNAGMAVAIVSEWGNNHVGYFNAAAGTHDANYSVMRAGTRDQPLGTAIYGTTDFDAQPSDMGPIRAYYANFSRIIRTAGYRVGNYGSGYCNAQLKAVGMIDLRMITCSSGFSGSKQAVLNGDYDLRQVFGLCDQTYMGLSVDWDAANPAGNGDWGAGLSRRGNATYASASPART